MPPKGGLATIWIGSAIWSARQSRPPRARSGLPIWTRMESRSAAAPTFCQKVGAAADRLSIRVQMGNPDLALGGRLCLADQIADPIQIVARPPFGGIGCRAEHDEHRPCVSHVNAMQLQSGGRTDPIHGA